MDLKEALRALDEGMDVRRGAWLRGWWWRQAPGGGISLILVDEFGDESTHGFVESVQFDDAVADDWSWARKPGLCRSVLEHPVWQTAREYFGERPHELRGLEVRGLSRDVSMRLQALSLACCTCGRIIHPFRQRRGSPWSELYFSPACPSSLSAGCSRGAECRDEVDRIRQHIVGNPVQRAQLGLFEEEG